MLLLFFFCFFWIERRDFFDKTCKDFTANPCNIAMPESAFAKKWPLLALAMRSICTTPCTTAAVERAFSILNIVVTDLRTRLSPATSASIMKLKSDCNALRVAEVMKHHDDVVVVEPILAEPSKPTQVCTAIVPQHCKLPLKKKKKKKNRRTSLSLCLQRMCQQQKHASI